MNPVEQRRSLKTIVAHTDETSAVSIADQKNPFPPESLASIEAFKVAMRKKYGKK